MNLAAWLLFLFAFIVFYSYLGYGFLITILVFLKKKIGKAGHTFSEAPLPAVTLVVAAFNEEDFIGEKIENSLSLDYPEGLFKLLIITDGSSDRTPEIASSYPGVIVMHQPERRGKVAAIERAMEKVDTPIVVFTDANTTLNKACILNIARHYQDEKTGGVAGEKKVRSLKETQVAGAGEGLYWKYESYLKKLDAELYTVVGAAGELFSIRTHLYEKVPSDVLLDDFIISLRICQRGYRVAYEPEAYAVEAPSASMLEEQKRKIRISAGGFQSIVMLRPLLNIFRYPVLSFQYISHRVLRWAVCPFLLPLILLLNIYLVCTNGAWPFQALLAAQVLFYAAALVGWYYSTRNKKVKLLYVPYYFLFLNISLYLGLFRYLRGKQSVLWDKAARENFA
ncbi:glycosyltransferase family 2 protein [Parasegetibacter sp. NRK P23]|uniref:glycosyltransferase family 2 protein n=1 Tax=Parasegetibacter sp. NRK P23 TaxID=2942999 RepID=UPI002043CC68|nr:glycosyltransferase family 2 protein [Parasegetibacter sp. NRK P23]MCM5529389.1 glycosyltransferase family 2 protein [Parasegetibacter sp. NRK P23]